MSSAPSQTPLDMTSVPFNHGGTQLNLTFTWGVFETLQAEWGDEYQAKLSALFASGDVTHLRLVTTLVSGHTFGIDTALPVQKLINALYRAYELGWSGRDVGPGPDEEASNTPAKKPRRFEKPSKVTSKRGWLWGIPGRIFSN